MEKNFIEQIISVGRKQIEEAATINDLQEVKASILGKKSQLSQAFAKMKDLSNEERAAFGQLINGAKAILQEALDQKSALLDKALIEQKIESEKIDISLPERFVSRGSKNPFYVIVDEFTEFFLGLGYQIEEGPEVEFDHFNFELLNIPKDHPARDMQDSFYIDDKLLMRSHTSPVQARVMQASKNKGPIKIICPGKVFRRDEDVTHSHQFGQLECLVIGEDVNMGQLQETLVLTLKHFFGEKREVRFRPSFFPFTEPSVEVDISCAACKGAGCSMCKGTGWIELLGGGMVHPNVLRLNGYDDKKYQGFAFGIGIERFALLKYGIDDIRRFYQNDIDFIRQFVKE